MKMSRLSIVGYAFGLFIIVSSTIRWHFLYPDFSQWILSTSIGAIVLLMAYLYNWMHMKDKELERIQAQVDAIGGEVFHQTEEAKRELALGIGRENL